MDNVCNLTCLNCLGAVGILLFVLILSHHHVPVVSPIKIATSTALQVQVTYYTVARTVAIGTIDLISSDAVC